VLLSSNKLAVHGWVVAAVGVVRGGVYSWQAYVVGGGGGRGAVIPKASSSQLYEGALHGR
jgi:hypothetical protein